jgi:hypothetical protein
MSMIFCEFIDKVLFFILYYFYNKYAAVSRLKRSKSSLFYEV